MSFIELTSATIFLSCLLPIINHFSPEMPFLPPQKLDWIYLIFLSLVCTTFAYVLSLKALKYINAFAINLVFNMEPLYGIVMAIFILKEQKELSLGFYLGSFIIMAAIFTYPMLKNRLSTA